MIVYKHPATALLLLLGTAMLIAQGFAENPSRQLIDAKWQAASAKMQPGSYQEAEALFREVLTLDPTHQRAALRAAISRQRAGKPGESLQLYDEAVAVDPLGDWAAVAMFYKSRAALEANRRDDFASTVEALRQVHPDSPYLAQAEYLADSEAGVPEHVADARRSRELEAAEAYDHAAKSSELSDEERLQLLEAIIRDYPDRYVTLRAMERSGHLLIRNRRHEEALARFAEIEERLGEYPDSRLYLVARQRHAALLHVLRDRESALLKYNEIIASAPSATAQAHALTQSAGLQFELLQHDIIAGKDVGDEQWNRLEETFVSAKALDNLSPQQRVIVDLMQLEAWAWRGETEKCEEAATEFFATYEATDFQREVATAHFFLGIRLIRAGRDDEGLKHLNRVLALYEDEDEIWPNMDHIPRILHELLSVTGDEAYLRQLEDRFPESPYLHVHRLRMSR